MKDEQPPSVGGEAKWSGIVADQLVPLPRRRLKARDILFQAGAADSATLVRDYNAPVDFGFDPDALVDLAEGNVFLLGAAGCERRHIVTSQAPKLAFIVDDRWEITIQPKQTASSLRGLLDIPADAELLRDFESPRDEPIDDDDRVKFEDGPVFITKRGEGREITIIVRGRPRKVTGRTISFDQVVALAYSPVRTGEGVLYTVSYSRGPKANPEGDLLAGSVVKIKEGMVFCVTETDKS